MPEEKIDFSKFKNGDLIFVADTSAFSSAVIGSTNGNFSHVGIIQRVADSLYVIEATSKHGVRKLPIKDFIGEVPIERLGTAAIKVLRLNKLPEGIFSQSDETTLSDSVQIIANLAVERALSFLGKDYDYSFEKGTEKLYCSELVYESFIFNGEHLFSLIPMNFKDSTGEISTYWRGYYKKMGKEVPQNEPGSNPNSIAASPLLEIIAF